MAGPFPQCDVKLYWADDVNGTAPVEATFEGNEVTLEMSSVTNSGGERTTGSVAVSTRARPHTGVGKQQPATLSMRLIFTTGGTDFVSVMKPKADAATKMWFLLLPYREGTATDTAFAFGPGYITNLKAPDVDAASGDPITVECEFFCDGWESYTMVNT